MLRPLKWLVALFFLAFVATYFRSKYKNHHNATFLHLKLKEEIWNGWLLPQLKFRTKFRYIAVDLLLHSASFSEALLYIVAIFFGLLFILYSFLLSRQPFDLLMPVVRAKNLVEATSKMDGDGQTWFQSGSSVFRAFAFARSLSFDRQRLGVVPITFCQQSSVECYQTLLISPDLG